MSLVKCHQTSKEFSGMASNAMFGVCTAALTHSMVQNIDEIVEGSSLDPPIELLILADSRCEPEELRRIGQMGQQRRGSRYQDGPQTLTVSAARLSLLILLSLSSTTTATGRCCRILEASGAAMVSITLPHALVYA